MKSVFIITTFKTIFFIVKEKFASLFVGERSEAGLFSRQLYFLLNITLENTAKLVSRINSTSN